MGMLELLLGDAGLERTITIKTKPQKTDGAPEMPLDPRSANLPQGVMDMMMGGGFQGQVPMQWGQPQMPQMAPQLPNFYQGG